MAIHAAHSSYRPVLVGLGAVLAVAMVAFGSGRADAAHIGLGEASSFAVLAGTTVTNTGPSVIDGNVGVSPGLAVVGFPPGVLLGSSLIYSGAPAENPKLDLTAAYLIAEAEVATPVPDQLGGTTLAPGVYEGLLGTLMITGDLILDADNDPNAEWILQAESTLITASGSRVMLINGANPCNVFWQVGISATLGTSSSMVGTVMALTSIAAKTGADVTGRLLAQNGAVTLETNDITTPASCVVESTFPGTGGVTGSAGTVGGVPATAAGLAATGTEPGGPLVSAALAILVGTGLFVVWNVRKRREPRR